MKNGRLMGMLGDCVPYNLVKAIPIRNGDGLKSEYLIGGKPNDEIVPLEMTRNRTMTPFFSYTLLTR